MGNGCEKCCSLTDEQTELVDGVAVLKVGNKTNLNNGKPRDGKGLPNVSTGRSNTPDQDAMANLSIEMVVKLQSLIRGFLSRRRYKVIVTNMQMANGMYFKRDEIFETLREGESYNNMLPLNNVKIQYKSTNAVYEGQMRGGFREGTGTMTWSDGAKYEGEWDKSYACGKGIFYHADGDIYDGNWFNNKCNGFGVYTNKKGARYEGHWKNDAQSGQGKETWPEGSQYVGQYDGGKKQGYGTYSWSDGSVYQGDWVDNRINGIGHYKWKDNRQFYGNWQNNDMHGLGIYIYSDGITYEGTYKEDKKTGYGVYLWTDGRKYEGWWYNGKQHGLGIYSDPNKSKVKYGLWEHGKRITWFNQQTIDQINNHQYVYETEFKDDTSKNYID